MANQIESGLELINAPFADSGPGAAVNAARLNDHVNNAILLNGAVINQAERTTPLAADVVLLGDSTAADTGAPLKVQIQNLLLQAQRDGTQRWGGVAGGTNNAITLATSPASAGAYAVGEVVRFVTAGAANTGAVTVNLDGRGLANLYNNTPAALASGDLPANCQVEAIYDGTEFVIVNLPGNGVLGAARLSEAVRGDVHQYQSATTTYGSTTFAVTLSPAATAYTAGMVVRFRAPQSCAAGDRVNVSGIAAVNLYRRGPNGSGAVAVKAGDFLAGEIVELVYDGTYGGFMVATPRTVDFIDTPQAFPAASAALTRPHGLGVVPSRVRVVIVKINATADNGYSQGDEVEVAAVTTSNASNVPAFTVVTDATNVTVARDSGNTAVSIAPKGGGGRASLTNANWNVKVYASV